MGAWGHGALENDGALDWLASFEETGLSALHALLAELAEEMDGEDPISSDTEEPFLALCEVIAAAAGQASDELEAELAERIADEASEILAIPNLRQTLTAAFARLAAQESELETLWNEADLGEAFREAREDTRQRALNALTT